MSLIIKAIKIVGYICGLSLLLETTTTSNPSFQFIQTPSVIYIGSHCVAAILCIYIANKFSKILSDITQKWLLALITLIILPQHLEANNTNIERESYISIREHIVKENIKTYNICDNIPFDTIPQMHNDEFFYNAYDELTAMLEGITPCNLKRAAFLIEWAYTSGDRDYISYCKEIANTTSALKKFIQINQIQQYKTAANAALFYFFTKPCSMNGYKAFSYDIEDCGAIKDFSKLFVSKVMKTHTGQCTSLPLYYKILCNELGGKAHLATAPSHMYIKHIGEDGKWVNVELTTGCFARDEWYIQTMGVSTEAIKNGLFLTALSDKEDIAFMMYLLGSAYQKIYKDYDYFTLLCANSVLKIFPHNYHALILNIFTRQKLGYDYLRKIGNKPSRFIDNNYFEFKKANKLLDSLGYSEISIEEYIQRVEKAYQELKKETPTSWNEFRDRTKQTINKQPKKP